MTFNNFKVEHNNIYAYVSPSDKLSNFSVLIYTLKNGEFGKCQMDVLT
jgi:hypothetical protein